MDIEEKKIYFVLSPHINYYHSYRGDSRSASGFGKDIKLMKEILDELDKIEDIGFSFGNMRITWDYADTFWSIQLQKEFQQDVLDGVIERCKKGKDEVLIGSWGNVAQPILDTEEFIQQYEWYLENSMGIGLNQLFPGRVAPYTRCQETMFTQGMIELYNKLGIQGICVYYSVYEFDVARPFLKPRLDWNQRYGLVKFNSTISDASCLMIPMYGFGDILDYRSIKRWFELIRRKQKSEEISGHALIFLNFDMDEDNWIGVKMPKKLQWMPNTRGLMEFAEAVDQYDFVEFTNLLEIIPKLDINGETTLREDVADGMWNGYYNWAQKLNNTKFWTVGQRARWLKCISDTLISENLVNRSISEINKYLREGNDLAETYLKNKILFASTTNFGMAVPFQHPHRRKTAMNYGLKAFFASEKAVNVAVKEAVNKLLENFDGNDYIMTITPITNRGISEKENILIKSPILVRSEVPPDLVDILKKENKSLRLINPISKEELIHYSIYKNDSESDFLIEAIIPASMFNQNGRKTALLSLNISEEANQVKDQELIATLKFIKNKYITLEFNEKGKIVSFKYNRKEFGCSNFLESAIIFGKLNNGKRYTSEKDNIIILKDGSNGFSASVKIESEFRIIDNLKVYSEKIITIYTEIPELFVNVLMKIPEIKGEVTSEDGTTYVTEKYDERWQEIMPCEIKPKIVGKEKPLRIWKKNFLGVVDYFDLDMKEVDPKNVDMDCLVSNISDGWMALSDRKKGLLIGFNSLKAANFAFSPIKVRNKGFGDTNVKGQQIRLNPFGTYFGKPFHYWTEGTGHAQKFIPKLFGNVHSTAPTFSGKIITFELILAPYLGDSPPDFIQSFADHITLPPLILIGKKSDSNLYNNYSKYSKLAKSLKDEFDVENLMNMSYLEWVREVNRDYDPSVQEKIPEKGLNMSIGLMLKLLIDGIRGK